MPEGQNWVLLVFAAVWAILGTLLATRPKIGRSFSERFEQRRSAIPFPPVVGVPDWLVRVFGFIALAGAGLFIYMFVKST